MYQADRAQAMYTTNANVGASLHQFEQVQYTHVSSYMCPPVYMPCMCVCVLILLSVAASIWAGTIYICVLIYVPSYICVLIYMCVLILLSVAASIWAGGTSMRTHIPTIHIVWGHTYTYYIHRMRTHTYLSSTEWFFYVFFFLILLYTGVVLEQVLHSVGAAVRANRPLWHCKGNPVALTGP